MIPLRLTIPYKSSRNRAVTEFDVSHLLYLGTNRDNDKIESRTPYLRSFCKKAKQYVDNGNRVSTVVRTYECLHAFIVFCDAVKVNPLSEEGYLKFAGNDGELRHRIKTYHPSKKLWERQHGDELGIKENSTPGIVSALRIALIWCGLPADSWALLHRGFNGEGIPNQGYSDAEEKVLVTRLSELFFTLAPQLIAAKKENLELPDELPIVIDLNVYQEVISIQTSLKTRTHGSSQNGTSVRASAAFNMVMGGGLSPNVFFSPH